MIKKIVILSGKGGTGKTTLTGSLHSLFKEHILADCDVDAANLHLLLQSEKIETKKYKGGKKASIISEFCIWCGSCENICRFDAIGFDVNKGYFIDQYACEGCKACTLVCPQNAIKLDDSYSGEYYHSILQDDTSSIKDFFHADLYPGEETSGGLVAELINSSMEYGKRSNIPYILIDGAPGIGCAATSSIVGAYYVIMITEPTESGFHDLKRLIETLKSFNPNFGIVINKWDLNTEKSDEIRAFAQKNNYNIIGKIPMDKKVMEATSRGIPVIEMEDSPAGKAIEKIYQYMEKELKL